MISGNVFKDMITAPDGPKPDEVTMESFISASWALLHQQRGDGVTGTRDETSEDGWMRERQIERGSSSRGAGFTNYPQF